MPAIMRDSTPPPSVRCSMKPFGCQISDEPDLTKQSGLKKGMIDDLNAFHGFITPGGKMSTQRLEEECSTALPSMCTTGSLESLPTTPAGWGTSMPPSEAAPVPGWQPGAQIWGLGDFGGLPPLHSHQHHRGMPSDLDLEDFTSFLDAPLEFPQLQWQHSVAELSEPLSEPSEASAVEQIAPLSELEVPAGEQVTPPSTPRKERTVAVAKTCPLAPGGQEVPMLLKALSKNRLNLVKNALESDPDCASIPFLDQAAEPPLCAAIRLGCRVDIVDLLLNSGADVTSKNFAGQNPLDLLNSGTCPNSTEIRDSLLRAGAEPSDNLPQEEDMMRNNMLRWDVFADAQTLNDFGLPPSLGSFGLFDIEPPPPVKAMA